MGVTFDTNKYGFLTVMRDYQEICLRFAWEKGEEGVTSGTAWLHTNKVLMEKEKSISRASVIFFLNDMVDEGVLNYRDKTGKGGHHRVYVPTFDEEGFKIHVAKTIISRLFEIWPEATREAIEAHER